jgi:DNA mismatch repair protein MutS
MQKIEEIKQRQDFVEEILKNPILMDKIQKKLSFVSDIDTILNRIMLQRASAKDLLNLKKSLLSILEVYELIQKEGSEKLKKILIF